MSSRARCLFYAALIVVVPLLICPSPTWAQVQQPLAASADTDRGGVGVGVKGGPLFSSFESSLGGNVFDNRIGWIGGLFFGGNRPRRVGVAVEILYAKKSATRAGTDRDLYYLEVPVLVRVNFGSSNVNRVVGYVVAGPAVNLNLKARQGNLDIKNNVERADLEAHIGGGVEIARFIIEGRFMRGLRNIGKDLSLNEEIKTSGFALLFGVRFN